MLIQNLTGSIQDKGKCVPAHIMEAQGGRRGIALSILNACIKQRWVINFIPQLLYPYKTTQIPTE